MRTRMMTMVNAMLVALLVGNVASAEVSKETLESISTPNTVKTSIGTLRFLDGAPLPETAKKAYDYLDTMRGVDAFFKGIQGAYLHSLI